MLTPAAAVLSAALAAIWTCGATLAFNAVAGVADGGAIPGQPVRDGGDIAYRLVVADKESDCCERASRSIWRRR